MASFFLQSRNGLGSISLALVCLIGGASAGAQTSSSGDFPVVDGKKAARLVVNEVIPEYPALAKLNYIQGKVRVNLVVSGEGRVAQAHVVSGHPILAASALKVVRRWLYRPLMTAVGPSPFQTTVDMNFTLRVRKNESFPQQADRDLDRQVKPPEVLAKPAEPLPTSSVRLRLLVSEDGQVIDAQPLRGPEATLEMARRNLEHWTFRPARWGTLSVPWYLEVIVPVSDPAIHQQAAADPGSR